MLILTDRPKGAAALHDYLARGRRCLVLGLQQGAACAVKPALVVCDVDLRDDIAPALLAAALKLQRPDARTPVLFLTRDPGEASAAQARAFGATEVVHCAESPALIRAISDRLLDAQSAATRPASPTHARAEDVKSALAACFDAAGRGEAIAVAELEKGAGVVVNAVKKAQVRVWLEVVREYDDVTYQHCLLVAGLVAAFAVNLGLTPKHQHLLSQAAIIHDVGKARVPPAILNKPGALTPPELEIMRSHAALGHDMLVRQGGVNPVILDVVRHHHEYLDGSGYPDRLRAPQISGYARITTICDIYAALIERRPYKSPMPSPRALAVLRDMGPKLDAELLKAFEAMIADSG